MHAFGKIILWHFFAQSTYHSSIKSLLAPQPTPEKYKLLSFPVTKCLNPTILPIWLSFEVVVLLSSFLRERKNLLRGSQEVTGSSGTVDFAQWSWIYCASVVRTKWSFKMSCISLHNILAPRVRGFTGKQLMSLKIAISLASTVVFILYECLL